MADKELELIVKFTGKLSDELDQALNKLMSTIQNTVNTGTEPLTNSVDKLSQTMKKSADSIKEVTAGAGRLHMVFGNLGERIAGMVKAQALFYTVQQTLFAVMGEISNGISSYYELEKKITDMAAITGANAEEQKKMSTAAREAGNTTAVSAEEAADAMRLLRQAGYDTTQTIQTLKTVTMAMTTTNDSAALTTDLLTTAMAAWNIPASRAEEVMSDLIKGADLSKLTMGDLKTAFNLGAGSMVEFNFSIKDALVLLGYLRDRGSQAGTSMRGMRVVLGTLTKAATDVNNELGKLLRGRGVNLDLLDATKKTFDFATAMDALRGKIEKAEIIKHFSENAREIMLKTIGASEALGEYDAKFDKLPSLQKRFDIAMGSTIVQLKLLRDNFNDLIKIFVGNVNPEVQNTTNFLLQLTNALKVMAGEATDENVDKIKKMGLAWIGFTEVLVSTYAVIQTFFTGLYAGFTTIYTAIQLLFGGMYKAAKRTRIEELGSDLDRLSAAGKDTTKIVKELVDAQADLDAAIKVSDSIAGNYVKDMEGYNEKLQKIGEKTIDTFAKLQKTVYLGPFKADYLQLGIEKALKNVKIRIPVELDSQVSKESVDRLKLEIKALEIKGNYGEKWIEKKAALFKLELIQEDVFAGDKKAIEEAVRKFKEKLRGEDVIQEKKTIDEALSRERSLADAKDAIINKNLYKKAAEVDTKISLAQKSADAEIKIATDFWGRLVALMAKDDLKKPFEVWADFALSQINKISDGIGSAFANAIVEGKNLQEELDRVWKGIASDLIRELASDALKSTIRAIFKSLLGDEKTGGGINWIGLIGSILGLFGGGGGGGGGGGAIQVHSGGYVSDKLKSYHSGGLNSNETVAKLRTDEYVMGPLATKKIGVDNLNEMNRSGQTGKQEKPQVNVPVQVINVTDPGEIARYITENPNVIINVVTRDKRFHGEIKRMIREG